MNNISIQDLLMHYIPSKTMRNFYTEQGISFTDRDCATVFSQLSTISLEKNLHLLDIVKNTTTSSPLQEELCEYLSLMKQSIQLFSRQQGFLYAVALGKEKDIACYVTELSLAKEWIQDWLDDREEEEEESQGESTLFQVEKHPFFTKRNEWKNPDQENEQKYGRSFSSPVGAITYNETLEMEDFWCDSTQLIFENTHVSERFLSLPHPFQLGDWVTILGRGEPVEITALLPELDSMCGLDWMDVAVTVGKGVHHNHINPLYLEFAT